jgi:hypothetical protein
MGESPPVSRISVAHLELLRSLGFGELMHDSHVPFLSHLIGTRRLLRLWNSRSSLCDAGLFHSVYGTEFFEPACIADRADVIALIGPEAERIAWLWCSIRRNTLDVDLCRARRRDNQTELLTPVEVTDIATLWAADTVEQIRRMAPAERAFSSGLLAALDVATEPARAAVHEIAEFLSAGSSTSS